MALSRIDGTNFIEGTVPSTVAPGAGKVLQVVSATKTDTFTSSTINTWLDVTGLSVSITPSSTANKILVMYTVANNGVQGVSGTHIQVLRNSTAIGVGVASGSRISSGVAVTSTDGNWVFTSAQTILDSPSTTSATTYKIQARVGASSSGTLYINRTPNDANIVYTGRFASTITVHEIAG